MTAILCISAFYHDAAALVVDGRIVAAAQEERFTRIKHDDRFPRHAVAYCLQEGGLDPGELDYVGFLVLLLVGLLVIFAGTGAAPFIYTLF
jgi:carbamoyltransferase